jgi:hypothetical protein
MGIKTFTKQKLVVLCNHNVLHKNVQVCFECIAPSKELLVKLLLPICLPPYPMFCIIRVKLIRQSGSLFIDFYLKCCIARKLFDQTIKACSVHKGRYAKELFPVVLEGIYFKYQTISLFSNLCRLPLQNG